LPPQRPPHPAVATSAIGMLKFVLAVPTACGHTFLQTWEAIFCCAAGDAAAHLHAANNVAAAAANKLGFRFHDRAIE